MNKEKGLIGMTTPVNRTFQFAPTGPYSPYLPQWKYTLSYTPPEKNIKERVTYYLLRTLTIIEKIIKMLQQTSPFFNQYSPVLKQLPNMYKMIKLIQEVQKETEAETAKHEGQKRNISEERINKEPKPTLFI